jgi:hypothetical protein
LAVLLHAVGKIMNVLKESEAFVCLDSKYNSQFLQARSASCQETNPSLAGGTLQVESRNGDFRRDFSESLAKNLPESDRSLKKLGY